MTFDDFNSYNRTNMADYYERLGAISSTLESVEKGYLNDISEYTFALNNIEKNGTYLDKLLEYSTIIYKYIEEKCGVNTLTAARKCIEKRDTRINPTTIHSWIKLGMFGIDMNLSNAAFIGYPEFKEELTEQIEESRKIIQSEKEKKEAEELV